MKPLPLALAATLAPGFHAIATAAAKLPIRPKFASQRDRLEKLLTQARKEFGDPVDFEAANPTAPKFDTAPKNTPQRKK